MRGWERPLEPKFVDLLTTESICTFVKMLDFFLIPTEHFQARIYVYL